MNVLRALSVCFFLLTASQMMHSKVNVLFVDPITIEPGETADIVVKIDYEPSMEVLSYSFHLHLPEGIGPNTKSGNWTTYCFTLPEETYPFFYDEETDEYTKSPKSSLVLQPTADGNLLVVWIGEKERLPLKSTHGELMRISVKASEDFVSGTGTINDIMLTNGSYAFDLYNIADVAFGINEDIVPDGVNAVSRLASDDAPVYTLQGVRASGEKKGLYISNGKKIFK